MMEPEDLILKVIQEAKDRKEAIDMILSGVADMGSEDGLMMSGKRFSVAADLIEDYLSITPEIQREGKLEAYRRVLEIVFQFAEVGLLSNVELDANFAKSRLLATLISISSFAINVLQIHDPDKAAELTALWSHHTFTINDSSVSLEFSEEEE